jgi:hypothetical protein
LIFGQNLARILNLSIAGLEPQTSADAAVSG